MQKRRTCFYVIFYLLWNIWRPSCCAFCQKKTWSAKRTPIILQTNNDFFSQTKEPIMNKVDTWICFQDKNIVPSSKTDNVITRDETTRNIEILCMLERRRMLQCIFISVMCKLSEQKKTLIELWEWALSAWKCQAFMSIFTWNRETFEFDNWRKNLHFFASVPN